MAAAVKVKQFWTAFITALYALLSVAGLTRTASAASTTPAAAPAAPTPASAPAAERTAAGVIDPPGRGSGPASAQEPLPVRVPAQQGHGKRSAHTPAHRSAPWSGAGTTHTDPVDSSYGTYTPYGTGPLDRSLPPTIKQRIRAEAHGSSPSVRRVPAATTPLGADLALADA
ncbi:DUF6344 domain-containing protein [Streptomyces sp. LP05-1]|uniref:DUF6344 domain-containing protein n=1 Tax=Streptomyces pyxinae TaxID=2970734 RepID=A0ABT2CCT7_9ACTN|nr:DUF6344 domain-containing protein [Streptomyces sp. LP05-1]MCS0635223.1 DUF6344 domain-containing protein [Streptomyces sp. LP05-1]